MKSCSCMVVSVCVFCLYAVAEQISVSAQPMAADSNRWVRVASRSSASVARLQVAWGFEKDFRWTSVEIRRHSGVAPDGDSVWIAVAPDRAFWDTAVQIGHLYQYTLIVRDSAGATLDTLESDLAEALPAAHIDLWEYMCPRPGVMYKYRHLASSQFAGMFGYDTIDIDMTVGAVVDSAGATMYRLREHISSTRTVRDTLSWIRLSKEDECVISTVDSVLRFFLWTPSPPTGRPELAISGSRYSAYSDNARQRCLRFVPVPDSIAHHPPDTLVVYAWSYDRGDDFRWKYVRGVGLVENEYSWYVIGPTYYGAGRLLTWVAGREDAPAFAQLEIGSMYPQPANAMLSIPVSMPGGGHCFAALYDGLGRFIGTVFDRTLGDGATIFHYPTSGMPPGVYFLVFRGGDAVHVRRLLIQR